MVVTKVDPGDMEAGLAEARATFRVGRFAEAAELLREQLRGTDADSPVLTALGAVLHRLGRADEAERVLLEAIRLDPGAAVAHDNLAVVLRDLGKLDEALGRHRLALDLDPHLPRARANYGLALLQVGKVDDAKREFLLALELDPHIASAKCGLADIDRLRGNTESAERLYRAALELDRRRVATLVGLIDLLVSTERFAEALPLQRRVVRLVPGSLQQLLILAHTLSATSRDHEALSIVRRLERQGAGGAALWFAKAAALSNLGSLNSSIRWYRKALVAEPRSSRRSGLLFTLHASARGSTRTVMRELQRWQRYCAPGADRCRVPHDRSLDPERVLRVGYISPDFRNHVVRQFFQPVLMVHDSDRFEFYCYAELRQSDRATMEIKALADRWYSTHGVSDEGVAEQIERDRIDILVDLAGHTAHNRLGVMACRPAPVQATYLGYFGSTGLDTIDYWITDHVLHPEDTDEAAVETIHRLPRCGFCYGVPEYAPAVTARSHDGPVVFGCFNNISKIGLPVIDAWAAILRASKDARLVLRDRHFSFGAVRRNWRRRFESRGVAPERVDLLPALPHPKYLSAYNEIDIALDPFPRTGGTTTCDALWMSTPVVTLTGKRYVERLSATKLSAVGCGELVVTDVDQYIAKALELANNRSVIDRYRGTLRSRMSASELCDPVSLARALENTYREFWNSYVSTRNRETKSLSTVTS